MSFPMLLIEDNRYLGKIYYNGDGVKQDKAEATEWFNKASEHGNDEAKRFLNDNALN